MLIASLAFVVIVATMAIAPLAEFANSETDELTSYRPGGGHAEGIQERLHAGANSLRRLASW